MFHAVDGPPQKRSPPGPNIAAIPAPPPPPPPPPADGPTFGMAFRASVEVDKWARKDEAVHAVSLRLGFQGELKYSTYSCMFEAMDESSGSVIARQLLAQYPSAGSRV